MAEGWIKLHRQTLDSEIFASEKGLKIWMWILLKANYKERFVSIKIGAGQSTIKIKRGQLLFGRFSAEDELCINGSTIYKWVKKMEQSGMITLQSNSHYTIITVCKYDEYNDKDTDIVTTVEQPSNSQVTADEQPSNTPKKDKKEKESKEIFNSFRKLYPGTKRGNETEFDNFKKKHKDWNTVLPTLENIIQTQIASRNRKLELRQFVPEWKNLQTWINQRCWEEEVEGLNKNHIKTVNLYYNGKCIAWPANDIENGKIQFANQNGGFDPELIQVK